jgi:hypothetical protein
MFLELLIAGTSLLMLSYIGLSLYQKKISNQIKSKTLETIRTYGEISEMDGHLTVKIDHQVYEILYIQVPANAELTINSKNKWDIHQIGKSHIIDQSRRLSSPYPKIVIIYPSTLRIKRYINENEMVFVSYQDKVYDYYLVRLMELDDLLKRLTDNA